VVDVIQVTVSAEGDVSDFDATAQQNLVSNMAATVDVQVRARERTRAGLPKLLGTPCLPLQDSSVTLTVSSGSVNLQFDIAAHSTEEVMRTHIASCIYTTPSLLVSSHTRIYLFVYLPLCIMWL
jgi:hypothetical protein